MSSVEYVNRLERQLLEKLADRGKSLFQDSLFKFPDQYDPVRFKSEGNQAEFLSTFSWGHNQKFSKDDVRAGAMSTRHKEILIESLESRYLNPDEIGGRSVLVIGCYTGGDALLLAEMGALVSCLEEHPVAAEACNWLFNIHGFDSPCIGTSAYAENREFLGSFDLIYCCGVIYHITDPLLLLRICYCYLKEGGRIITEGKLLTQLSGSYVQYHGGSETGWNYYSPTKEALARWYVDAGFDDTTVSIQPRFNGNRHLSSALKSTHMPLAIDAGFSRVGSDWLVK